MLHLLPDEQKKLVLVEYRKRLGIVSAHLVTVIFACGIVLLLPTYLYSYNRYEDIKNAKATIEKNINSQQDGKTADTVKKITEDIEALQPIGVQDLPSSIINKIVMYQGGGIHIRNFTYAISKESVGSVQITGNADQRNDLIQFVQRLNQDGFFSEIKLPLSSLTKESKIDFTFNLVVKGTTSNQPAK